MKRKNSRVKEIDEEVKAIRQSINKKIREEKALLFERQSLMGGLERNTGRGPKSKGRAFENEIVASILAAFPQLTPNDVWARSMGDPGVDIILSEAALKILPLAIECKRVGKAENLNLPAALLQAQANAQEGTVRVVVYREDRHRPIAAMWLSDLAYLLDSNANVPEMVITFEWPYLLKFFGGYKK